MAWSQVKARDGEFEVDWMGAQQVIRSWLYSRAKSANASVKQEALGAGGVIDFFLKPPVIHTVEVDFKKVKAEADNWGPTLNQFVGIALNSREQAWQWLRARLQETRHYDLTFADKMRLADQVSRKNIQSAITRGERGEVVARWIRDWSAEFLIVGATGGGLGVAAAGGFFVTGATLKASAKYEGAKDGQKWQAFGTELAFTATFGILSAKAETLSQTGKLGANILIALVQPQTDPLKAWLSGEDIQEAFLAGAIKSSAATWHELAKQQSEHAIKRFLTAKGLSGAIIPFSVIASQATMNLALEKGAEAGAKAMLHASHKSPDEVVRRVQAQCSAGSSSTQCLLDAADYDEDFLRQQVIRFR